MKNCLRKRLTAVIVAAVLLIAAVSPAYAAVGKVYQTAEQGVRLRKTPVGGEGNEDNIIRSLPINSKVVHLSSSGNWWRVRTAAGEVGYVFNSNLKATSSSAPDAEQTVIRAGRTYKVKASSLVVRKSASTKSKKLGSLRRGSSIKVVAVKNGWAKVTKKGRVGFVKAKYLG